MPRASSRQPIETARDPDLRLPQRALLRAAERAYELAAQTGTAIVVRQDGAVRHIFPRLEELDRITRQRTKRREDLA